MQPGYFCAAGINKSTDKHVRPVIRSGMLSADQLSTNGGPFDMAALVDLGDVRPNPAPPETEDHLFYPKDAHLVRNIKSDEFWELINIHAKSTLTDIFGPDLKRHKQLENSCVVDYKKGKASLGCLSLSTPPRLYMDRFRDKVRVTFNDGTFNVDLSVTDLRLYEADLKTPRKKKIKHVAQQIRSGTKVILGVGLTRPWQKNGDTEKYHWLQANNIHLEDDPVWRLDDVS